MTSMSSTTTDRIVPVTTPCPADFALGYLKSSIRLLKEESDRGYYDADAHMERIKREIERLAQTMEQINRELYPDLT
jgi:hypothetical protein